MVLNLAPLFGRSLTGEPEHSVGTSANIKADLQFRHFLGRGKVYALVENMLVAIAHNIGNMHHKIQFGC